MYVKIVRYLEGLRGVSSNKGEEVVPKEVLLVSSKFIEYSKFRSRNQGDFDKCIENINSYIFCGQTLSPGEECDIDCSLSFDQEFVLIRYLPDDSDEYENIISYNCHVYIMNDDGKTIDSLTCV